MWLPGRLRNPPRPLAVSPHRSTATGVYRRGLLGSRGGRPVERCDVEARVSRLQQVEGALRELKLQQVGSHAGGCVCVWGGGLAPG